MSIIFHNKKALVNNENKFLSVTPSVVGSKKFYRLKNSGSSSIICSSDGNKKLFASTGELKEVVFVDLIPDNAWVKHTTAGQAHPRYDQYSASTKETGAHNASVLNEALRTAGPNKIVKIRTTANYPITLRDTDIATIEIINTTLDLNKSSLYTTDWKYSGVMFTLKEGNPKIENGTLCGSYDKGIGDVDYETATEVYFEHESLVSANAYTYDTAEVENIELMNAWGYALTDHGFPSIKTNTKSPFTPEGKSNSYVYSGIDSDGAIIYEVTIDSRKTYSSSVTRSFIAEWGKHKYIGAVGGLGYDYILSDKPITYKFYDANDVLLSEQHVTPRQGATFVPNAVVIKMYIYAMHGLFPNCKNSAPDFHTCMWDTDNTQLLVKNCKFHNNFALGMVGGSVETYVKNCESYCQGIPFIDSELSQHAKTGTVGFCDVEDVQTPKLTLDNVVSHDEKCLLMDGTYVCELINCTGKVGIYRGWKITATNHTGTILTMDNSSASTLQDLRLLQVKDIYLYGHNDFTHNPGNISNKTVNGPRLHTDGNPIYVPISEGSHYFPNFVIDIPEYSVNSYYWNTYDCSPIGRITAHDMSSTLRLLLTTIEINPYLNRPTHLIFNEYMRDTAGNNYGVLTAYGDIWGLDSNTMFLPNDHTIHNSIFNISDRKTYGNSIASGVSTALSGTYDNCTFNITGYEPFKAIAVGASTVALQFTNCTFSISGATLFYRNLFASGSTITFTNCTINGKNCASMTSTEIQNYIFTSKCDNLTIVCN